MHSGVICDLRPQVTTLRKVEVDDHAVDEVELVELGEHIVNHRALLDRRLGERHAAGPDPGTSFLGVIPGIPLVVLDRHRLQGLDVRIGEPARTDKLQVAVAVAPGKPGKVEGVAGDVVAGSIGACFVKIREVIVLVGDQLGYLDGDAGGRLTLVVHDLGSGRHGQRADKQRHDQGGEGDTIAHGQSSYRGLYDCGWLHSLQSTG